MKILTDKKYQELELDIVNRARKEREKALQEQKEYYENQLENHYHNQEEIESRIKERLQKNLTDSYISIEDYSVDLFFKDELEAKIQDLQRKDSQAKSFKAEIKEAEKAQVSLLVTIKDLRVKLREAEEAQEPLLNNVNNLRTMNLKILAELEGVKMEKLTAQQELETHKKASKYNLKLLREMRKQIKGLPETVNKLQKENDSLYRKLNVLLK